MFSRFVSHASTTYVAALMLTIIVVVQVIVSQPGRATVEAASLGVSTSQNCPLAWRVESDNIIPGYLLKGIAVIAPNDVWAAGSAIESKIATVVLHWDGRTWSRVPSPNPGTTQNYLNDVDAVASNDIWAVGGTNSGPGTTRGLVLHWDGTNWREYVLVENQILYGVKVISPTDVWAVGSGGRDASASTMHWDGSTWTDVTNPMGAPGLSILHSVDGVSSDDVWAVGDQCITCRKDTQTLALHWDGRGWDRVPSPNIAGDGTALRGISVSPSGEMWAVGDYMEQGRVRPRSLSMRWVGAGWVLVPIPNELAIDSLKDVETITPNDVWAVGVSILHWDGQNWSGDPGPGVGQLESISALSPTEIWAAGAGTASRYSNVCQPTPTTAPTSAPTSVPIVPTVLIPGSNSRFFPETSKTVRGLFLDYWEKNGELPQQGYPISEVTGEISDLNGKPYTVQYFERAVFEYHPENQSPFNVLLSQLGTFQYRKKYPGGASSQKSNDEPGSILFQETGKRLGGKFLEYWNTNGGLPQQGFPISNEFTEVSELNGKPYTVQYFERAVFEHHPENQPPYDVLLSQLGTFQYKSKYPGNKP